MLDLMHLMVIWNFSDFPSLSPSHTDLFPSEMFVHHWWKKGCNLSLEHSNHFLQTSTHEKNIYYNWWHLPWTHHCCCEGEHKKMTGYTYERRCHIKVLSFWCFSRNHSLPAFSEKKNVFFLFPNQNALIISDPFISAIKFFHGKKSVQVENFLFHLTISLPTSENRSQSKNIGKISFRLLHTAKWEQKLLLDKTFQHFISF